jgi:iron complex outermembrane receptor protein
VTRHQLLAACATSALTLFAGGALAQTAPAPAARAPAAPSAGGTTIGEIVVTAERREANLQEVPEAVTAFTAQDRNLKGISTVQDLTNFTPGFTYSSQLDRPAMRGLSRSTNIYLADSSVGVYYDDFFSNSTFLVGRDDMLIDQVEILLGPQGTLYGRNAIGGLINTISKRPQDEYGGEVRAIAGNYGYTKFEFTVTGPVAPHLNFRLSAYQENQTQGWFNNLVPGTPSEGGIKHDPYADFQLEYKTDSDDIWFDTYVVGFNNDRGGPGSLLGTPTPGNYGTALTGYGQLTFNPNFPYGGGAVPGSVVGQIGNNNPIVETGNLRNFAHSIPTSITVNKAYTFVLHWTHHFDDFDLKYIGGYSQYHYELHTSYFYNGDSPITSYQIPTIPAACSATAVAFGYPAAFASASPFCKPLTVNPANEFSFTTQTDWSSHELQIATTWNKPIQLIGGLYYFWETDNNPEDFQLLNQPQIQNPILPSQSAFVNAIIAQEQGLPIPASSLALPNPSSNFLLLDYQDRIQSAGIYGQADWKFYKNFKFTAGARYTWDWKHGQEETRYVDFSSAIESPYQYGSLLPATDISTAEISFNPAKGVCGLPFLNLTGPYAGDWSRCLSDHSNALTGTVGVEWTPDSNTLAYVRYNRGYKAFAFNAGFVGFNPEAAPEYVNDVEVGYKHTIGNKATIDIDAYHYGYFNDQVPIGVPAGSVTLTEFINVPRAVSEGVEVEAYWRPLPHLDLTLTYGFDYTNIQSTCNNVGGVATGACYVDALDPFAQQPNARPVGNPSASGVFSQAVNGAELPNAPQNKIALNGLYTWQFNPGNLIFSATYIWKDKSYGSIFTRFYDEAPSWSQVNLRLTWSGNHDRYEVVFYVNNLFNLYGYDAALAGNILGVDSGPGTGAGPGQTFPVPFYDLTPPRQFGAEFHYKF